jgi:hypothetical protein
MPFIDFDRSRSRQMAARLQFQVDLVRARLESGPALSAAEIAEGVRMSHEDFLYLARAAMRSLNQDAQ